MRSVVLSGFMATGKSTVGPALAERLGVPFVDTDADVARAAGKTVAAIWRDEGEGAFRALEADAVARALTHDTPRVVALGGGAVTRKATRRLALDRALVVTMTAAPEALVARLGDTRSRPLLAGGEPLARVTELLEARAEAYAECHLSLGSDVLAPDDIVEAVAALVARDPLVVPLGARTYTIDVCRGDPSRLTDAVARCAPSSVVLVTDSNVQRARGAALEDALRPLAMTGTRVTLAPGERQKTLANVSTLWDAMLGAGIDREALVVAAGGGVVGDLAGFAAACVLRGVRVLAVPTTLLAMVDSSVGGKTGFDHAVGKNLVGAFHQPSGVVVDLAHLATLPRREIAAGLAEVVKMALALDEKLVGDLEAAAPALSRGDPEALEPIVRAAIGAKLRVVRDDEREGGRRALLNLGHTVGHALETHGGFGRWIHGEAVALGTLAELRATVALGWTPPDLLARARDLFAALGLPASVAEADLAHALPHMAADKKRSRDQIVLPVVTAAGASRLERVGLETLREALLRG